MAPPFLEALSFVPGIHGGCLTRAPCGAIFDGEKFLIIGGSGVHNNEVCTYKDDTMTCVYRSMILENYFSPELFLVEANYGKDLPKCS